MGLGSARGDLAGCRIKEGARSPAYDVTQKKKITNNEL